MSLSPDPETVSLGTKIAGFFATMTATAWGIFKAVDRKIEQKADAEAVNSTLREHTRKIDELGSNQREDKTELRALVEAKSTEIYHGIERIENTARLDRNDILAGIAKLTEQSGRFQSETLQHLGDKPGRDEIAGMIDVKIRAAGIRSVG